MAVMYSQNGVIIRGGSEPFTLSDMVNIVPINKMAVVDKNGYIGYDITEYFQYRGNTYYYNYAILSNGSDFSESGLGQVTFYTPATSEIGGRVYNTVIIGGVEWLAENLDYKFTGCAIGQSGTSTSEPRANYYNNDESTYGINGNKYGLLYNWTAVKYLEDNKSTLIPGWHVPTLTEYQSLATAVGTMSDAGTKLKSSTGWAARNGDGSYAFNVLPTGMYQGSSFSGIGTMGNLWTITAKDANNAQYVGFASNSDSVGTEYYQYMYKTNSFSLRLVRDSN